MKKMIKNPNYPTQFPPPTIEVMPSCYWIFPAIGKGQIQVEDKVK